MKPEHKAKKCEELATMIEEDFGGPFRLHQTADALRKAAAAYRDRATPKGHTP